MSTVDGYTLRLEGVRFRANMGVSQSERAIPQEIVVDVELVLPVKSLPPRDRRQFVVDYDAVAGLVIAEGRAEQYRLLETYAQRLIHRLLAETPALHARVKTTKLRMPTAHNVDRAVVEVTAKRAERAAKVARPIAKATPKRR